MPPAFDQQADQGDAADDLGSREAARTNRRDHDADAAARDLMRPGMGKVFKQIQDAQAKAAREPSTSKRRRQGKRRPPQIG